MLGPYFTQVGPIGNRKAERSTVAALPLFRNLIYEAEWMVFPLLVSIFYFIFL